MNPTKRERIAMLTEENTQLKERVLALTDGIKSLTADNAVLQAKLATPAPILHDNKQYPVKVEYRPDPALTASLADALDKLAIMATAQRWLPIESAPDDKPILVKFDNAINDLGTTHVMIKRGMWWYSADSYGGRRLAAPVAWREVPE